MTATIETYSGINDYKKLTFVVNKETKQHQFHTELREVEVSGFTNLNEIFNMHLSKRQTKFVEVLYSGGYDSEVVLQSCMLNKIPVRAITMRIVHHGILVNTPDLYYAERFCRQHDIEQKFVDLHSDVFVEDTSEFLTYLTPYMISEPHVAMHMWLFEQCTGYPVMGGEYNWPWEHESTISPFRHDYSFYDDFLKSKGIDGIGNMLSHSLESNALLINAHKTLFDSKKHGTDTWRLPKFRQELFGKLGYKLELRLRSYGFNHIASTEWRPRTQSTLGITKNSISWGPTIAKAIGSDSSGYNERF